MRVLWIFPPPLLFCWKYFSLVSLPVIRSTLLIFMLQNAFWRIDPRVHCECCLDLQYVCDMTHSKDSYSCCRTCSDYLSRVHSACSLDLQCDVTYFKKSHIVSQNVFLRFFRKFLAAIGTCSPDHHSELCDGLHRRVYTYTCKIICYCMNICMRIYVYVSMCICTCMYIQTQIYVYSQLFVTRTNEIFVTYRTVLSFW